MVTCAPPGLLWFFLSRARGQVDAAYLNSILNSIMLIIKISFVTTSVLVLWVTIGADPGYPMLNRETECARMGNFVLTPTVLNKNMGVGRGSSVV